jgi:hypothetical protein
VAFNNVVVASWVSQRIASHMNCFFSALEEYNSTFPINQIYVSVTSVSAIFIIFDHFLIYVLPDLHISIFWNAWYIFFNIYLENTTPIYFFTTIKNTL